MGQFLHHKIGHPVVTKSRKSLGQVLRYKKFKYDGREKKLARKFQVNILKGENKMRGKIKIIQLPFQISSFCQGFLQVKQFKW